MPSPRNAQGSPRRKILSTLVALAFSSATLANPTGPAVVSGSASFATAGRTLTVTNTPSAILNWQGFSIGVGETTRFQQQSAASSVMNRVVGQDPSAILGTLSSNGRVFLLNPNGIVFGVGSRVDVAGLVATTLNLSNQDFLAGRLNFQAGAVANSIVNHGEIVTPSGGRVYLIAPNVENHGVISTPQGQTILAAGRSVQLVEADVPELRVEVQAGGEALNVGQIIAEGGAAGIFAGLINQQGLVRANSVSRDATGQIVFRSDVVINTGTVQADGAQGGNVAIEARNVLAAGRISADGAQGAGGEVNVQASGRILQTSAAHLSADGATDGGKVTLQASDRVFGSGTLTAIGQGAGSTGGEIKVLGNEIVLLGARLDASGDAGGGTVLIGGDFQGNNLAVQNATSNWINFSTTINADARTSGDGGKVIVWSDQETKFYGSISARGGTQSGDGGFIEVSGKENLIFGGMADASAPNGTPGTLLLDPKFIIVDSAGGGGLSSFLLVDPNPGAGDGFGERLVVLPNDNVVANDPNDDFAASNAGAVYLFNGTTGALISTLSGTTANDQVGISPVTVLSNGNYVVRSPIWNNGAASSAGAATFGSGTTGVSGAVSAANSLVGTTTGDGVGGSGVTALTNGNYVVESFQWNGSRGAATWGDGSTAGPRLVGAVSAANSLVGTTVGDLVVFGGVTALSTGNYVVVSSRWDNGAAADAGAVTFGSGNTGVSGAVSAANSLVGTTFNDQVGSGGVTALSNGNYVVSSRLHGSDTGAVTFGSGTTGVSGAVTAANSLVGTSFNDQVGSGGVTVLTNGNYVVRSPLWANGGIGDAGAVTFGSGTTGISGAVSAANSLVGTGANDRVGSSSIGGVTALTNGNYVVNSSGWANGAATQAGAVTFGNGTTGVSGAVSAANSLVGTTANDLVGNDGVTALSNGNYVVRSGSWNNGAATQAGAVTFGSGTTGISGAVSAANSLVGTITNDRVGDTGGGNGVMALTNGSYVVIIDGWDNGAVVDAGAVTFGNGTTGISGAVSAANSLVGTTTGDRVGDNVTALTNGNYVVASPGWDNGAAIGAGAATFGNGTTGISGAVTAANSLVGTTAGDGVGGVVTALTNGNYVVRSFVWNNGAATGAGAVTFGNGTTGVSGAVSAANSLVGTTANDIVGDAGVTALNNGNYVVRSQNWNGARGAVTWGNGAGGTFGAVSAANSLVGSTGGDSVGSGGVTALSNGNYVVTSLVWDNILVTNAGAVSFGNGTTGVSGAVSAVNSLVGTIANDQIGFSGVTPLSSGNVVVRSRLANNGAIVDAGLVHVLSPSGGGGFTNPLGFADNAAGTTTITPAAIIAITNNGTAVTLQANTDITLAAASAIITNNAGGDGGAITMQAGRSVVLNSSITTDNGNLTITANEPGAQAANRDAGAGGITMAPGTTLNAGTGTVALTVSPGVPGNASGNLVVENITAANVNLQQTGRSPGNSILRASANSLITATNLLLEVDLDNSVPGGSVGTAAAPMRVAVTNLESHTHEASPGIFIDSPTQGLTIGGVPFFVGSVKGVQNVTSGDISVTANGNLTTLPGTAGCGTTGGTGGPVCTGSSITLVAGNGDLSIGNVITHIGAGAGSLTARATNSILVGAGANITSGGGAFGITLNSDSDASGAGAVVLGNFAPLVTIDSNGGNILIGGGTGAAGFAVGDAANGNGIHLNGAALSSGAGSMTLRGQGFAGAVGMKGISMQNASGSSIQSTTGAISLTGTGGTGTSGNTGVQISGAGTFVRTQNGTLTINATGAGSADNNYGLELNNDAIVEATGSGSVSITGQGSVAATGNFNYGIRICCSLATDVRTTSGALSITGTGGGAGTNNDGLSFNSGEISASGAGNIALMGQAGPGTNSNRGIDISNTVIATAGGNILLDGDGAGTGGSNKGVSWSFGSAQTTGAGSITITGQAAASGATGNGKGIDFFGGSVTSVNGAISISGTGGSGSNSNEGVNWGTNVTASGSGNITITGTGGAGIGASDGVNTVGTPIIMSGSGNIAISGTGGAVTGSSDGVDLAGTVQTGGSGSITVIGQAAASLGSKGVRNQANFTTASGSIAITGTGSGSTVQGYGVDLISGTIRSTGGGPITITGTGSGSSISEGLRMLGGTLGDAASSSTIVIRTASSPGLETIDLGGGQIRGSGQLFLEPINAAGTIGLGGGAGEFNLISAELNIVQNGFSQITIGHPSGTGLIFAGTHTFNNPIILRNTGAGSAGIISGGTLGAGANDLNLFSAGTVNVRDGSVSGANIGINAGDLIVRPLPAASFAPLVNATGNLTVNANNVQVRGSDTSVGIGAKLQAAGTITINAGSLSIEGGNANNAGASIDPPGIAITTTGSVSLTGGAGLDSYALIQSPTGNISITAGGAVTLLPGTGLNANAAIVADIGAVALAAPTCIGCTPLLVNPISGPSLLANGIFGNPVTVGIVVAAAVGGGTPILLTGLVNQANEGLILPGDEEGAQSILVSLGGAGEDKKDEQTIFSCR